MKFKFNKVDKLILFISLAVVIVFSYFLYDDSFLFHDRQSNNSKIGNIKTAENDVRLRASDSFTWNSAKKSEIVFERDSVFTGKKSQTQIDLIDGSKIFLNENSLVTLVAKNGSLELNLRYGDIKTQLNPTSKLELKAGSQKIYLNKGSDSSTLEIKKQKFGMTKIKLLTGSATVKHSSSEVPEVLVVEQTVIVKPTGSIQKSNPGSIELLTPNNVEFYQGTLEKGFYLDWHSQNMEKNNLLISKDQAFKAMVVTESGIKTKVFVKDLPTGVYFWKITGTDLNASPFASEIRSFKILVLEKISIIEPPAQKKWNVETSGNIADYKEKVKISWTNLYDTVQAQISETPDFKSPILDKEFIKQYEFENSFTGGTYFLRVRGKKLGNYTNWSDIRTIEINVMAKGLVKPGAPVLLTKHLTFHSAPVRSPSSLSPAVIKWQGDTAADRYELEVSLKDPKFTKAIRIPVKNTKMDYIPKNVGTIYYRVRSISSDNLPSDYSQTGELQTKLFAPKLTKIESVIRKSNNPESIPPPVQFKLDWSPIHLAGSYTVEYANNSTFNELEKFTATANNATVTVSKTGPYYFRVIASDISQSVNSEPSNIENSQYKFIKRLGKPVLIEPKNKMTVFLQKEIEPFIWLNWDSTVDQKKFEIEIALDKSFKQIVTRKNLDENRFLIKDKLPLGKIYWRVRQLADNPDLISDWTEPREFQLIHNKNEGVFK